MRRRKMWKSMLIVLCLYGYCCHAGPVKTKRNIPIMRQDQPLINEPDGSSELDKEKSTHELPVPSTLTLPSNATSIRADIMDGFKCDDRPYGYYADVENDCQIFHVCLPVTYADGKENMFRWSFICPEETIFSQDSFTCMRPEDMNIDCSESQNYYDLNRNFGMTEEDTNKEDIHNLEPVPNKVHEEALSVFSDKKTQSDTVVVSSSNLKPSVVKPDKPKRVYKPSAAKPIHSVKSKPTNLLPLRKMPQTPTVSEPVVSESTQNHLNTFNQKRRRPIQTVSVETQTDTEKTAPVPVLIPVENEKVNAEKISTLKSDHTKGSQTVSISNLGKLELPNTNAETAQTTETQNASELVPTIVKESSPTENLKKTEQTEETVSTDKQTNVILDGEKLSTETVPVNEPVENNQSENTSNEVAHETITVVETSPNSEMLVKSPTIFEENSEEISSTLTSHTDTNTVLKEADSVVLEEKEKETAKPEDNVLNQNEKLETVENTPLIPLDSIKEDSKVENELVEEASHIDEANENVNTHENLELNVEQVDNKDIVDNLESEKVDNLDSESSPEETIKQTEDDSLKQSMGGFKPVDAEKAAEAEALITDFLNTLRSTETTNTKPNTHETSVKDDSEDLKDSNEIQKTPLNVNESKETEIVVEQTKTESADKTFNENEVATPSIVEEVHNEKPMEVDQLAEQVGNEKPMEVDQLANEAPNSLLEELKSIVGGVQLNTNSQALKTGPIATYPIMNSFPADMYQIPVKVIEAPAPEPEPEIIEQNVPILLPTEEEEIVKEPTVEVVPNAAIYTPLSIEDIVDLVKERLDQTPIDEKNKPMLLTLESLQNTAADTPVLSNEKDTAETTNAESSNDVATSSNVATADAQETEEVIMPIYHRLAESDSSSDSNNSNQAENELTAASSAIQTETNLAESASALPAKSTVNEETENKDTTNTNVEGNAEESLTTAKTKSSRLYRSRSIENAVKMDPRKRRFLFRSDAN